jgi:hypothetical protein
MAKSQQVVPVKTPIRDWVIQHCMNKVYAPLFGLQKNNRLYLASKQKKRRSTKTTKGKMKLLILQPNKSTARLHKVYKKKRLCKFFMLKFQNIF